jgi:hypothetical protein
MLLVYNLPNKPTAGRVFVWRKLKQLGAMLLHDAVWVLPATPHTREQFRWLASEIEELKGDATVWECQQTLEADEERLVAQFARAVDLAYRQILAALKRKNRDLAAISRRYQQLQTQDHFKSELGQRVRQALLVAKGGGK